jgi:hypothetical protein
LKSASGEIWCAIFLKVDTYGTGFSTVGYREAFHGLGVQDVTELDSDWCSVFLKREKKREKRPEDFFPWQTCSLAMLRQDFLAVRYY